MLHSTELLGAVKARSVGSQDTHVDSNRRDHQPSQPALGVWGGDVTASTMSPCFSRAVFRTAFGDPVCCSRRP